LGIDLVNTLLGSLPNLTITLVDLVIRHIHVFIRTGQPAVHPNSKSVRKKEVLLHSYSPSAFKNSDSPPSSGDETSTNRPWNIRFGQQLSNTFLDQQQSNWGDHLLGFNFLRWYIQNLHLE
jgi:hypothetical protein